MKAVYVGRHVLLPAQERGVRELGLEIIRKVENLPEGQELTKLINDLKNEGVEAVITVALPPHLLATLSKAFRVFVFEMKSSTVPAITEAEKWVAENPEKRTYLPGRPGEPTRVMEFVGINEVKVIIESKRAWTA
jgi:predicted Fe-Mo cluster-binding NifX family protein